MPPVALVAGFESPEGANGIYEWADSEVEDDVRVCLREDGYAMRMHTITGAYSITRPDTAVLATAAGTGDIVPPWDATWELGELAEGGSLSVTKMGSMGMTQSAFNMWMVRATMGTPNVASALQGVTAAQAEPLRTALGVSVAIYPTGVAATDTALIQTALDAAPAPEAAGAPQPSWS